MLAIGWREPALRRLAVGAIAVVAMLSAIGLATPGARLPAVPLANLLGGAGLLAILAAAHASASGVKAASRGVRIAAAIAVALVLVQAFLGGSVAAHSALLACPAFPGCDGVTWSAFASGGAWNPLRAPAIVDEHIVAPAGAGALHLLHRIGAIVLAALVLAIVATLWRPRGGLASALGIVLASALAAGIAAALVPSSLGATLVHNAAAALLVALLARAAVGPAERAYARTTMSDT
jgi:cytochrome c oxidase assembly protein subunit 15